MILKNLIIDGSFSTGATAIDTILTGSTDNNILITKGYADETYTGSTGSGGDGAILEEIISLSASQVGAAYSTPITLVAAPGAGKMLVLHRWIMFWNTNGGGLPPVNGRELGWDGTNVATFSESDDYYYNQIGQNINGSSFSSYIDKAFLFSGNTGGADMNPSTYPITVEMKIYYTVMDFN